MRVHVISDMEGVAGIVKWEQTTGGESLYEEGRKLYTEEINAAVRGAKAAGATEIVVMDCHGAGKGWTFNSLIPEDLDPACEFVVQDEWTEYTEFLEAGCDAALFVGMHARAARADGVMNHTISGRDFQNLWFNGTLVGETGHQRRALRDVGLPGAPRHRRRRVVPRGEGASRRRPDHRLGEERLQLVQRAQAHACPCARAHRGGREASALGPLGGRAVRPRQPLRDQGRVQAHECGASSPLPAGVELSTRTIVSRADTWWEAWTQFYF